MTNLIVAGMPGAGKSTVGRMIADRLGMAFIDTDEVIAARAGKPITDIFTQDGEDAFRQIERTVCRDAAKGDALVIAVGGGALLNRESREACDAGNVVVCLTASPDAILARAGADPSRPLYANREAILRLLVARAAHYASFRHTLDTTGKTPEQVADEVIAIWTDHS